MLGSDRKVNLSYVALVKKALDRLLKSSQNSMFNVAIFDYGDCGSIW